MLCMQIFGYYLYVFVCSLPIAILSTQPSHLSLQKLMQTINTVGNYHFGTCSARFHGNEDKSLPAISKMMEIAFFVIQPSLLYGSTQPGDELPLMRLTDFHTFNCFGIHSLSEYVIIIRDLSVDIFM